MRPTDYNQAAVAAWEVIQRLLVNHLNWSAYSIDWFDEMIE